MRTPFNPRSGCDDRIDGFDSLREYKVESDDDDILVNSSWKDGISDININCFFQVFLIKFLQLVNYL